MSLEGFFALLITPSIGSTVFWAGMVAGVLIVAFGRGERVIKVKIDRRRFYLIEPDGSFAPVPKDYWLNSKYRLDFYKRKEYGEEWRAGTGQF